MSFDYDRIARRYREFWNLENKDLPLFNVTAPKKRVMQEPPKAPATDRDRWLDTEYQIRQFRWGLDGVHFLGDSYPLFNPNLGPDLVGAVCGCDLNFGDVTSWAEPSIEAYEDFPKIVFDENNRWWKKICEITKAAVDDANGDYLVGISDLHPGADAVVSLRGAEVAAMDLYDEPEQFKQRVWEVFDVFKKMTLGLHDIISAKQQGCSNWMGILHPDALWYVTSCDFAYMISQDHFEEFVAPELQAELDWLPASIFHLDGIGSLRHLDRLLDMQKLKGIQWVYGMGQPTAQHWVEVYQKIQQAGKCLEIPCEIDDVLPLCEVLEPQGVRFNFGAPDKESAEAVLKEAERIYRQKRGVFPVK